MSKIFNQAPNVETELGRELRVICAIGVYTVMSEKQIHAAILGRAGVCSHAGVIPGNAPKRRATPVKSQYPPKKRRVFKIKNPLCWNQNGQNLKRDKE